jgi:hypothetical protein
MYRLARIRLAGVGPADARFDKPSPDAPPFEVSCIGAAGAPEDTVVWLENGGGKTVFLALLFHVLRPDKAAQIGNDEKGRRADIPDFVLSNDVAHVVCEWVADDSDARLITGLVADHRGANVNRTWYLLAVRDSAATLDDLAFDVDGRRVPAARYVESLEQLASKAGKSGRKHRVELTKTGVQRQWFETLADHDLDPALFEYQVRMNRSEGGATSLFKFTSAEKFVEFFLQLTMNPDTVAALSEELARVADKVLSLPRKELELAHATGAVDRLSKLASAWSEFETADAARTEALQHAEFLHDRLAAAVAKASAVLTAAEKQVELAEAERVTADKQRRESDTRAKTVAIALADERVAAIQGEVEGAAAAAAASRLTADAWPRVPQMLRRSALAGEVAQVRVALDTANEDAAPLRARRDALLRTLRGVLDAQVRAADTELTDATEEWEAAAEAKREADRALADATGAGKELDGRIREITRQVEAHYEAVKAAVTAGLLPVGVAPRAALDQARTEAASAAREVERLKDVRREFTEELPELRNRLSRAAGETSRAEHRHTQRRDIVAGMLKERERLAAHPLLAELGAEDADLELVGADLVNRVAAEADRQRALAIASVAASAEDQRAVDTLDRDRLLPARAEVEALCRTLAKEGVTSAMPGWRYLVEAVPAAQHAAAIAAHPALVDGIVVATHDLDHAREVLAGTNPSAAILIAAGAVLADTGAPAATGWVVPPAAALHDRSAAEAELDRRRDRIVSSAAQAEGIAGAEHTARALANALATHLDTWPPGALPAAIAERDELEQAAATARTAAVDAQTAVATVEGWLEETDGQLEHQRTRLRGAEGRTARPEQLATAADTTAKAERELASLQQERAGLAKAANRALAARTTERGRREAAAARKVTAQRALDGATQVLADLPEVGDGPMALLTSLAELRAGYERAVRNLAEATTDSELSRQLARLESDRAEAEAEWLALDGQLRSHIEELAASPAAIDPVARRTADHEARRAADEAAAIHAQTLGQLGVAKEARRNLPDPEPTWPVEPFEIPTDLQALEAFSISLEAEAARTREQRTIAIDKLTAAKAARDARRGEYDALAAQVAGLTHGVGEREVRPASPFEGDAAAEVRSALRAIADAGRIREEADLNWRRAATAVARWARDGKWKELTGDLTRRLRDEDPDLLARDAAELLAQTRILEDRLRDDIAKLDTHRQMLLTSLGDAVSEAARSLRIARKKSELPAGLGDWSHQPFLKIACEIAKDRTELDARLRRYINDLLERAPTVGLPTGADLVCQAVLACAEKTVTVAVLKPNKAQRLRYVPITETATLSGGMRATAAIAMFCTLAKVRAANRTGRVGMGTLVLDNPLGDANATYLVALQRLVAQMSDVQLVYATGVNDMDALRLFPVVTRLTNEAAKRSHLAYVIADEAFLKRLAPSDGDDAIITGARLVRRQQPLLIADLALLGDDQEDDE